MSVIVGKKAPSFTAQATDGSAIKEVSLADHAGKWVVLFFYPLDFTAVCPTEIKGYAAANEQFTKAGAQLLGCSIDSVFSHQAWIQKDFGGRLPFPLIGDLTKEISRKYGVLLEDKGIALRGTFIIDPEGTVQAEMVNHLKVGRSTDETLRLLKAFQSGEACPADWKEGQAFIGK